jgi:hypothetical protein
LYKLDARIHFVTTNSPNKMRCVSCCQSQRHGITWQRYCMLTTVEEERAVVSGNAVKSHAGSHLRWQLRQTELNLALFWSRSIRTSTIATNAIMRVATFGGSFDGVGIRRTDRPYCPRGCNIPAYGEFYRSCPPCLYMYPWGNGSLVTRVTGTGTKELGVRTCTGNRLSYRYSILPGLVPGILAKCCLTQYCLSNKQPS